MCCVLIYLFITSVCFVCFFVDNYVNLLFHVLCLQTSCSMCGLHILQSIPRPHRCSAHTCTWVRQKEESVDQLLNEFVHVSEIVRHSILLLTNMPFLLSCCFPRKGVFLMLEDVYFFTFEFLLSKRKQCTCWPGSQ